MQTSVIPDLALYYPSMIFRDNKWLRYAFLTWNKIGRISDEKLVLGDSDDVVQLSHETEFLHAVTPTAEELSQVSDSFIHFIDEHEPALRARYSLIQEREAPYGLGKKFIPEVEAMHFANAPIMPGDHLSYVYAGSYRGGTGKLTSNLMERLEAADLGFTWDEGDQIFIGLDPRLAWVYMSALVEVMAEARRYQPVTDMLLAYRATGRVTVEDLGHRLLGTSPAPLHQPQEGEVAATFIHVALENVLPKGLADLDIKRLIAFKSRHEDELLAFQKHVQGLESLLRDVAAISDKAAMTEHLDLVYKRETRPLLKNLERAIVAQGMDAVGASLVLRVDVSSLTGSILGAAALATGAPLLLAGVAFGAGLIPFAVSNWRARRQLKQDSPVSYLLSAKKELSSRDLLWKLASWGGG
jgi:Family of unknown function (DUF6236)